MNNIYLSGPEWLTQYDCDVFNAVAGMFKDGEKKVVVTADQIYEAIHSGQIPTLNELAAIIKSVRKLAHFQQRVPELLEYDVGPWLFPVCVVIAGSGLGFSIQKPCLKRIELSEIIYCGGKTEIFW